MTTSGVRAGGPGARDHPRKGCHPESGACSRHARPGSRSPGPSLWRSSPSPAPGPTVPCKYSLMRSFSSTDLFLLLSQITCFKKTQYVNSLYLNFSHFPPK